VGVEKDLMTAFTWCKKAVDQNHEDAKVELEAILLELEDLTKVMLAHTISHTTVHEFYVIGTCSPILFAYCIK